jgi:hypothetical protein
MLRVAAAVQAVEAAGLCLASVLAAADAASGRSSSKSSGMALAVLGFLTVAILAGIARGIARMRPWSRTPAVLTQVTTAAVAVFLIQGGRYEWGIPGLVLAAAGLAGLLSPASFRALLRH